jgi:hypothetical protein
MQIQLARPFFDFAVAAAFLMFLRAAVRCLAELMGPPKDCSIPQH